MKSKPSDQAAIRAIAVLGLGPLSRRLGISKQAVSQWQWKGVPPERVLAVETATGIPREELRPDIFGPPESKAVRLARVSHAYK